MSDGVAMAHSNITTRPKGQSLTEFALSLPVLLLILMAVIDFGRVLFTYAQASNNVRNALRYGMIMGYRDSAVPNYLNCGEMRSIASNVWFAEIDASDVTISYIRPGSTNVTCTGETAEGVDINNGDILHISLNTTVDLITPLLADTLTLNIEGQRTLVRDIELPRLGETGGGGGAPDPSEYCEGLDPSDITADDDSDGLADRWECGYIGDIYDEDGAGNPDSDLCHNECEESGSSNPKDPTSPSQNPSPPTQLDEGENPGANSCSVLKSQRFVGLSWPQMTGFDPPVTGYRLYATPANGPRTLIGEFTGAYIPADPTAPVKCGFSQNDEVGGVPGCFNMMSDSEVAAFWNEYGSKTIDYSVRAYSSIGQSRYSTPTPIDCVFRVDDIALRPEGDGLSCEASPYYTGLQWMAHPDAAQYRIYAAKIDYDPELEPDPPPEVGIITAIPGLTTMVCGYSVDNTTSVDVNGDGTPENIQGCFNVRPNACNPATDYTTFMVVPENALGVIGPYQEAVPPHGMLNPPKCK